MREKREQKRKNIKKVLQNKSTFWKYTQKPVISRLKKYMSFLQKKYNKLTYLKSMQLLYFNNIKSKDTNTIKFRSKKKKKKKGIIKSALVKELHKKKKYFKKWKPIRFRPRILKERDFFFETSLRKFIL